jgi:hypothetical protein
MSTPTGPAASSCELTDEKCHNRASSRHRNGRQVMNALPGLLCFNRSAIAVFLQWFCCADCIGGPIHSRIARAAEMKMSVPREMTFWGADGSHAAGIN